MESAQKLRKNELYVVGDFGDTRLKKPCSSVPAHAFPANSLWQQAGNRARNVQFCRWLANMWQLANEERTLEYTLSKGQMPVITGS